ncbi:MAG: hypothetical protein R2698_08655 [Microthrixaceae bacterium]
MSKFIPTPNDVFRKIDGVVVSVDDTLEKVETLLDDVRATLGSVDDKMEQVEATLTNVETLLGRLRDDLGVLDAVPAMQQRMEQIHSVVLSLAGAQGLELDAGVAAAPKRRSPARRPTRGST